MASDPSQLYAMLAQGSGLQGQYFQQGQDAAQQQQLQTQQLAQNAIKLQQMQQSAASDASYQSDVADYQKAPTMDKIAGLLLKYPGQADAIKQFWAMKDPEVRQSQINAIGPVVDALDGNHPDLAITGLQNMRYAYAKAGQSTDDLDSEIQTLQTGGKDGQNLVKANLMLHLAAADPEGKFADSLAKVKKAYNDGGGDPYTLGAGDTRFDGNNTVVARGAPKPMEAFHYTLKDAAGNDHEYIYDPSSGQPHPPGAVPAPGASNATAIAPNGQLDPTAFYKQFVLPHEGGYAPHDANGAPVNHGINQSANPGVDVKNLSADDAAQIFATKYFPSSANLPPALAAVNADTSFINPKRAAQFLQASGGDPTKYMAMRQSWMNNLVQTQPGTYGKYAHAWNTRNADLSAYAQNLAGGGSPSSGAVSGGVPSPSMSGAQQIDNIPVNNTPKPKADDFGGDPTAQGSAYLASLPVGKRNYLNSIAAGMMAAPRPGSKYGEQVAEAAATAFPGIDTTSFPARLQARQAFTGNGKAAQIGGSISRLGYHLNDAYEASQQLSGPNLGWSPLSNVVAGTMQSGEQVDAAKYDATLPFISGEIQKLVKNGAATEGEGNKIMANLSRKQPTDVRNAALGELAKLATGAFQPYVQQWQSAFPGTRPPVDISPLSAKIYDSIINGKSPVGVDNAGHETGPAPVSAAPVKVTSRAQAMALRPGTIFIAPDGRRLVR